MDKLLKVPEKEDAKDDFSFKKLFLPLTTLKVIHIIFIVGFIAFGNALLNDFVADDNIYIINNPQTHIVNVAQWFGPNSFNTVGQYRPISAAYFSLLYALFGSFPFFYHFLQIILHTTCTVLIYVLFRKFFSAAIAFLLALVFLVHPMNVESVSYIAQSVNQLFFLFGIIPLFLVAKGHLSTRDIVTTFFLLLLSMLTKETGILFLFLTLVYSFLFTRKHLLKWSIGAGITLIVYAFFRFVIGHVGFETRPLAPIADLNLSDRLLNVPMIFLYYFKTFVYPAQLAYLQNWVITSPSLSSFYLPLIVDLAILIALFGFFISNRFRSSLRPFIFFLLWFAFGLSLHLQIFALDMTVGDRWFYFPMVGLLGMLGIMYNNHSAKRWPLAVPVILSPAVLIICLFAARTMVRNSDWQNAITLLSHDSKIADNFAIQNSLGVAYGSKKDYTNALVHYQRSAVLRPNEVNLLNIGVIYAERGEMHEAKKYFEMALHAKDYKIFLPHRHHIDLYKGYAWILVFYKDSPLASSFIQDALSDYPDSSDLWLLLALSKYSHHDKQGALNAAFKAYQLNRQNFYIYERIQDNESISMKLNDKTFQFNPK